MAQAFGQDWFTVARRPFHETLWAYAELLDAERIERLVAEGERVHAAFLVNYAVNNPPELAAEQDRYATRLRHPGYYAPQASDYTQEELVEASRQIFEEMNARFAAAGKPLPS